VRAPAAGGQANLDTPSRIPPGQVTTQPSLIATMVAALELRGKEAGRLITDTRLTPARFVPLVGAHGITSPEGRGER
jgi:hypothetical protein